MDRYIESAVDWMVLLSSGSACAADLQRFDAWRAAHPRHAAAWGEVEAAVGQPFAALRRDGQAQAASLALRIPPQRRKLLRGGLGLVLLATGATLAARQPFVQSLAADLRTDTGERLNYRLSDGSDIVLNARSAVDIDFAGAQRRIRLHAGAIHVRVAADAKRPLVVCTVDGEVTTREAEFTVARKDDASVAAVLEQAVQVSAAGMRRILQGGEGVVFGPQGVGAADTRLADQAAWRHGMLVARDESLGSVIASLRAYRRGFLRVSPAAANLRVFGAFPLDDTDSALASLAQTLPISLSSYGGWLVTVDLAPGASA